MSFHPALGMCSGRVAERPRDESFLRSALGSALRSADVLSDQAPATCSKLGSSSGGAESSCPGLAAGYSPESPGGSCCWMGGLLLLCRSNAYPTAATHTAGM